MFHVKHSEHKQTSPELEPDCAVELAGVGIDKLRAFATDLIERGEQLGLIGPQELPRLWTRHLLNSALLAPQLKSGGRIADVGSGGGFPGLVLAIIRPDVEVRLVEPMERRCAWLSEQLVNLELDNAAVYRGRAEEFHGAWEVDQVTARAVTALKNLIPLTAPLAKDGGELLFLKGMNVAAEVDNAQKVIRKHRLVDCGIEVLGTGVTEETRLFRATVQRNSD